tara:strand:- start:724 stop:1041 length:318 start_codon:yes stop_codon:yes gene_type:complete
MRAGRLDREITLVAITTTQTEYGGSIATKTDFATLRAQLIEASTEDFLRSYGTAPETLTIFRTRWIEGVTTAMRLRYEGRSLEIVETKEIGRRIGLEIRCKGLGT